MIARRASPLLLCLAVGLAAQHPTTTLDQAAAERVLAQAKRELAPDRRTVVFDVSVKATPDAVELTGEVHDEALAQKLIARFGRAGSAAVQNRLRALPDPELGDRTFAIVCVSVANLRSKPGHPEELATQVLLGTPLRVLKRRGGWLYVQTPNDYLAWTCDRVQRMDDAEFDAWRAADKVIVTATSAHVLEDTDPDARPVSDVVAGGLLELLGQQGDHHRVRYPDGREGYLPRRAAGSFTRWLAHTDDAPDRLLATARRFSGVPYLWGGTSTKGMDCSGFTSTVFLLNGVLLPRDASQQVRVGVEVPIDATMSQVKAGDLLFFGQRATADRGERVTHVGLSLGGMRFIHESTDVRENSFDPAAEDYSAYRRRTLLHVRRVVDRGPEDGVLPLRSHPLYVPK